MTSQPFLFIDTTDKIMGIPVKHVMVGAMTAVMASFLLTSFTSSPPALLLIPLSGYLAFRISLQMERTFPGTSFYYYQRWFSSPQVAYPGPDEIAVPLVIPSSEYE